MPDSDEQIDTVLFLKRAISNLTASFGGFEPSIRSALMYPLRGCHLFSETLHYTAALHPPVAWHMLSKSIGKLAGGASSRKHSWFFPGHHAQCFEPDFLGVHAPAKRSQAKLKHRCWQLDSCELRPRERLRSPSNLVYTKGRRRPLRRGRY